MKPNGVIRVAPLLLALAACGGGGGGSSDTTPPTGTIVVAGGAAMTANLIVDLTLTAVDTESGMGAGAQMRFSNDGATWSPAESFALTRMSWNLSSVVFIRARPVIWVSMGIWILIFSFER